MLVIASAMALAQTPDFLWVAQAGGPNKDEGNSVSIDPYGNIVVTGFFYDSTAFGDTMIVSHGSQDVFIAKYDRDGHLMWVLNDGGLNADLANDVSVDNFGNIYVTGKAVGSVTFGDSTLTLPQHATAFVVKYNTLGEFQWVRAYPSPNTANTYGIGISADPDGNIYMVIDFGLDIVIGDTTITGHADGLLLKLDATGSFLWARQFISPYPNPVYMADVAVDGNGNCIIAGNFANDSLSIGDTTLVSTGGNDIFLAKYLPDGTLDWVKQGTGSSRNYAYDVATDPNGNIFLCGDYWYQAIFDTLLLIPGGLFLVKYDPMGNVDWGKSAGGNNSAKAYGVAAGPDGSVTLVGFYKSQIALGDTTLTTGQFDLNALMVNYQANGDFAWALQAGDFGSGSGHQDEAYSVAMDATGAAVVTGYINDGTVIFNDTTLIGFGYHDVFVTKILEGSGLFPQIVVSPTNIQLTLPQDSSATVNLSIHNLGGADLTWTLTKQDSGSTLGDSLDQIIGVSPFSVGGIAYDPDLDAVWVCDPLLSDIYLYEKHPPYNRILTLEMPGNVPGEAVDVAVVDSLLYITDPDVDHNNDPFDDLIFAINKYTGDYEQTWFVDGLYNSNPADSIEWIAGITVNDAGEFFVTSDSTGIIRKIALYNDGMWETLASYPTPYFGQTGTISWDAYHQGFWLSHLHDPEAPFYFTDTTFQPVTAFPKLNPFNATIGVVPTDTLWLGNTPYVTIVDGRLSVCDWLSADLTLGTVAPGGMTNVTLTVDPSNLDPGNYTCYLTFHSNDPYNASITVPVKLTVESSGVYYLKWLGTLGGNSSEAFAISANGRYVVGRSFTASGERHAYRWDLYTEVMEDLGTLGGDVSDARGISADGRYVVGFTKNINNQTRAFRWDAQTGTMEDLGTLAGNYSKAFDISADGRYVVGASTVIGSWTRAFRWDAQTGTMQELGTLGGAESWAYAISDDGRYVVGVSETATGSYHAFRWDEQTGVMQDLGTLGGSLSEAHGISANGDYVVGISTIPSGEGRAFRWSEHTGTMLDLGTLGVGSYARDISGDGRYVFGSFQNANSENRAFRWNERTGGMEDLNVTFATLLNDSSTLTHAMGVTPGTRFIVGKGFNAATGREEAYILDTLSIVTSIRTATEIPKRFALFQNYPNPFNPSTTIEYQLSVAGEVTLRIYDILGRQVRELVNERQKSGYYKAIWDGTNDAGLSVASGVYLYRLKAGDYTAVRKMVLLR